MDKKKVGLLTLVNGGGAALLIALYSPGLIGLSFAGSAIEAAFSAALGATILSGMFMASRKLLTPEEETVESLPQDGLTFAEVSKRFERFLEDPVIGDLARQAIEQAQKAEGSMDRFEEVTGMAFGDGISKDKFVAVCLDAIDTIQQNLTRVYTAMMIFDSADYLSLAHYKEDDIDDAVQEEKIASYNETLSQIRDILTGDEKLLTSILNLMLKISKMEFDAGAAGRQSDEIRELEQQLRYYKA